MKEISAIDNFSAQLYDAIRSAAKETNTSVEDTIKAAVGMLRADTKVKDKVVETKPDVDIKEKNYITVQELADEYKCSTRFIYNEIKRGKLKAFKVGKTWLTTPKGVVDYENKLEKEVALATRVRGE